jgi:hypothetical protein
MALLGGSLGAGDQRNSRGSSSLFPFKVRPVVLLHHLPHVAFLCFVFIVLNLLIPT